VEENWESETAIFDRHESDNPFTLGGLWENSKDTATGEWVRTFTIVTTDANSLVAQLHDRMPVIIAPENRDRWLDPGSAPEDLLRPYPADQMTMWPVSTKVNSPKNEGRELIEPIQLDTEKETLPKASFRGRTPPALNRPIPNKIQPTKKYYRALSPSRLTAIQVSPKRRSGLPAPALSKAPKLERV
jgi:hypothetical protein